jgi:biopolymer transport protein ExbD
MPWKVRHEGSPKSLEVRTAEQVAAGLRDGQWHPDDEVMGPQDRAWVPLADHPQFAELAAELEAPPAHAEDETHLDMNALIDVCLVLLIFFMLTTSYVMAVQKVVPLSAAAEDQKAKRGTTSLKPEQVKRMVRVHAQGDSAGKVTVRVEELKAAVMKADGKTLDADKFVEALRPYTRGEDRKTEMLLDARDVSWGQVVAIQDAARSAGIRNINLVSPKKQ